MPSGKVPDTKRGISKSFPGHISRLLRRSPKTPVDAKPEPERHLAYVFGKDEAIHTPNELAPRTGEDDSGDTSVFRSLSLTERPKKSAGTLCIHCRLISLRFQHNLSFTDGKPCPTYQHQPSLNALYQSAEDGCDVCRLFTECLKPTPYLVPKKSRDDPCVVQQENFRGNTGRYNGPEGEVRQISLSQGNEWCAETTFFFTEDDTAAMKLGVLKRAPSKNPISEGAIDLISKWMFKCDAIHIQCHDLRPLSSYSKLPTRVIDLGEVEVEEQDTRLFVTCGERGRYVAFSHVWGGMVPAQTTTQLLGEYCKRLPLAKLPQSFRDAVLFTRRLGIRYLWIDALCIIQDSAEDWRNECAKMSNVYQDAYLVIAAPDTLNSEAGFLSRRPDLPIKLAKLPCYDQEGHLSGSMSLQPTEYFTRFAESSRRTTLLQTRAWALQEYILSRRTVFLGEQQTYWVCAEANYDEQNGTADISPMLKWSDRIRELSDLKTKGDAGWYGTWCRIVEDYSKRNLTNPQDKLPALSGLAKDYHLKTGYNSYLAGHWKEHFIQSLTWQVMLRAPASSGDEPYRAPTWSWASVDTHISFENDLKSAEAKVLDFKIEMNSADPFGGILSASATVRGKMKVAEARYKSRGHEWSLYEPSSINELGPCLYDRKFKDGDENLPPQVLHCFRLAHLTMSSYHSGVLLLQLCEDGTYRRVGYGEVSKKDFEDKGDSDEDWFRGCQVQDITIV